MKERKVCAFFKSDTFISSVNIVKCWKGDPRKCHALHTTCLDTLVVSLSFVCFALFFTTTDKILFKYLQPHLHFYGTQVLFINNSKSHNFIVRSWWYRSGCTKTVKPAVVFILITRNKYCTFIGNGKILNRVAPNSQL